MTWRWIDIPRNRGIDLVAPDPTISNHRDHTWMGIRKGGERWFVLLEDDTLGWVLQEFRPFPSSGQPIRTIDLQVPSLPTTWNPLGVTNNKKHFIISSRDISAVAVDQLTYYDVDGNLLGEFPTSDALDRDIGRLVWLNHDFYVLADTGGDIRWSCRVYDARAQLIRSFSLVGIAFNELARGITTDGKYLYVLVNSGAVNQRIIKYDVRGAVVDSGFASPGDGFNYQNGITFNGKYLLTRRIGPG